MILFTLRVELVKLEYCWLFLKRLRDNIINVTYVYMVHIICDEPVDVWCDNQLTQLLHLILSLVNKSLDVFIILFTSSMYYFYFLNFILFLHFQMLKFIYNKN